MGDNSGHTALKISIGIGKQQRCSYGNSSEGKKERPKFKS